MRNARARTVVLTRGGHSLLLVALLIALVPLSQAAAQAIDEEVDPVEAEFAKAEEQGLVMHGLEDVQGLKRILEHHFDSASLFGARVRGDRRVNRVANNRVAEIAEVLREAGIDPAIMREMESLVRGMDVSIYRVEFVPGFTSRVVPEQPNDVPEQPNVDVFNPTELGDDGGLTPGIPRGESLVSDRHTSSTFTSFGAGGWISERRFSDGTTYVRGVNRIGTGNVVFERTTNRDGTTRHSEVTVYGNANQITSNDEYDEGTDSPNMAEDYRRSQRESRVSKEVSGEKGDRPAEGEGDGAGDAGDGADDEDIDQYQPAEDAGGTFCPLLLEHCRRALEEMVESKDEILVGSVLINPGDPDEQPKGSRFVYDPENLVINPSLENARGEERQLGSRRFWMTFPVLVNPPGPND